LVRLVPTFVNAEVMELARVVIAAVAPSAMIAATRAYSIRSCPDSSRIKRQRTLSRLFVSASFIIAILLLTVIEIQILVSKEMLEVADGDVNCLLVSAQRE
jgi:hypothetical protein